jgi:hypothetical protein
MSIDRETSQLLWLRVAGPANTVSHFYHDKHVVRVNVRTPPRPHVYDVGEVSPVDQTMIDLVSSAAVWRVPGFGMDSFVHEVYVPFACLQQSRSIGGRFR